MLSRSMRVGRAEGDRDLGAWRRSWRRASRARRRSSFLESLSPRGMRSGSRMTAAATTGPASGPRPASSQPATGQTPACQRAALAAERRTEDLPRPSGRRSAFRGFGGGGPTHARDPARRGLKSNGTEFRLRMAGKTWLVRQDQPPVVGEREARRLDNLPGVAVRDRQNIRDSRRIRSSPAAAAVRRRPRSPWRKQHRPRPASRNSRPASCRETSAAGAATKSPTSSASLSQSHSASTTPPASKNAISSPVARTFRLKPKRFIEPRARRHVAHAERHRGQFRRRLSSSEQAELLGARLGRVEMLGGQHGAARC